MRQAMRGWPPWEATGGALRPLNDRPGLLAARLEPTRRAWPAGTLEHLGRLAWARLARDGGAR